MHIEFIAGVFDGFRRRSTSILRACRVLSSVGRKGGRVRIVPALLYFLLAGVFNPLQAQITKTFTQPIEQCEVASSETGVVTEIRVREGDKVRRGDVLGILNIEVLVEAEKLAVLRSESTARIESTAAILAMRQSKLQNLDSLVGQGHANPFEIEQAKSQFQSAQAEYKLALQEAQENRIELAKIRAQISQRTIRSPIDGHVTKLHRQLGEYVSSSSPAFATVVQLAKLKANFYLDADSVAHLSVGQQVSIAVDQQGLVDSIIPARIQFLSPIIEPDTGTGRVEVVLDNERGNILSGTTCRLLTSRALDARKSSSTSGVDSAQRGEKR